MKLESVPEALKNVVMHNTQILGHLVTVQACRHRDYCSPSHQMHCITSLRVYSVMFLDRFKWLNNERGDDCLLQKCAATAELVAVEVCKECVAIIFNKQQ